MKSVVLAGGRGTRLWPKSRYNKSKQLQALLGEKTLLETTVNRLLPLSGWDDLYVLTDESQDQAVLAEIEGLLPKQIIRQPSMRETAPAIGLSTAYLMNQEPQEVVGFFPSDHYIEKEDVFQKVLRSIEKFLQENREEAIITLGIQPTEAKTGYGYILGGEGHVKLNGYQIRRVDKFVEKPNQETAREYLEQGGYFWNGGIFLARVKTFWKLFQKHLPNTFKQMEVIKKAFRSEKKGGERIKRAYQKTDKISLDHGIMEKAENVFVVPISLGWSDIGDWSALKDILSEKEASNVVIGEHIGINTVNCLIQASDRPIATVDLRDLIVVDDGDVIMIAPKGSSNKIKSLVKLLEERGKTDLL